MNLEELLKPFKDASAAWEIDIAQILDEYIEESDLRSELIDFRSIATLLRGSTNVFARKVDYIHDFATRMFSNCSAHIQTRSKGTRRVQPNKDGLSAHIVDYSELPDLQSYVNGLCATPPPQIAEEFLSRKLLAPDVSMDIANIDYKIIPKQPATVLLAGENDSAMPTSTPFYRAHRDMLTGALLLETWNTGALIRALGDSSEDYSNAWIDVHSTENLSKSNQPEHSSVTLLDRLVDPVPVCMVTPIALSSVNMGGLSTPHNSRIGLLHGVTSTDIPEDLHNFHAVVDEDLSRIPMVNAITHDSLTKSVPNQALVDLEHAGNDHNNSEPKLSATPTHIFTRQRNLFDLSINSTYQNLIDKLTVAVAKDTSAHKHHIKSRRTYLDPHTLQVARDARLQEIEAHPDGFRRCVIKESLLKICTDIFSLGNGATTNAKWLSRQQVKKAVVANQPSANVMVVASIDPNNFNEPDELVSGAPTDGTYDPPVSIGQVHNNLKPTSIGRSSTTEYTNFESVIQKKILELQREAAIYSTSKSVLKWNTYIENVLSEEGSRPLFNIELLLEKYRRELTTSRTQLSTLCKSTHSRYDIVRSFAAILHIASEKECLLSSTEDGDIIIN
ncbi:Hypothetical protein GLP15_2597 [Giardia lamblia P15]|uniref:Condensin II complex subunit H2 N-terminal domain-containing protein n=1 Tax=Giardia intestinalis (strain P15) TaxID=658858 RepID=E1F8S8_GIAIA|nr:Hypothetical protein GLP15_2597 [Giardia lamblia P15]